MTKESKKEIRRGGKKRTKPVKWPWLLLVGLLLAGSLLLSFGRTMGLNVPTWDDVFLAAGLGAKPADDLPEGLLRVHFIDVGQAEAILIECGGERMLLDAGSNDAAGKTVAYLRRQGVERLDVVAATHPHEDHIGGMDEVLRAFPVGRLLTPEFPDALIPADQSVRDLRDAMDRAGLQPTAVKAGDRFSIGSAQAEILSPVDGEDYADLNNRSLCIRLTCGKTRFLFTGDLERDGEERLLQSGADLSATVLKLGHHGAGGASSDRFLRAVAPEFGVILCGKDNDYGHPHASALARADRYGIRLYRTDRMGTIVMTSDGKTITVETEKGAGEASAA